MTTTSNHLPAYPSKHVLSKLPPSQLTTLTNSIYSRITQIIALPTQHRDIESVKRFVQTYVKDTAVKELDDIIWGDDVGSDAVERMKKLSKVERAIRRETLKLVDVVVQDATSSTRTSGSKGNGEIGLKDLLDLQTILDLCIVYTPTHPKRLRSILQAVFDTKQLGNALIDSIKSELIPAFTLLLASSYSHSGSGASDAQPQLRTQPGLYALRKTSHCIICLFRVLPTQAVRRIFCDVPPNGEEHNGRKFLLSIASAYGTGLESIARNYGGLRSLERIVSSSNPQGAVEDWEKLWVETKAALVDVFHISFKAMVDDLTEAGKAATGGSNGRRLAGAIDNVFGLIYALLELHPNSPSNDNTTHAQRAIPFLNRSLLEDYQHAYDLARTLSSSLSGPGERDARLDHLEVVLQSYEDNLGSDDSTIGGASGKDAGVLKILLKSSGVPLGVGVNNLGMGKSTDMIKGRSAGMSATITSTAAEKGKGKAKEVAKPLDPVLESKVDQVLDILPDYSRAYVRALLEIGNESYPFRGDPGRVVAALLEGTAPGEEELERLSSLGPATVGMAEYGGEDHYDEPQPASSQVEFVYTKERMNVFDNETMDLSQLHVGKKSDGDILRDRSFIEQMKADILRRAEEISDDEDEESGQVHAGDDIPDDDAVPLGTARLKIAGDGEGSEEEEDTEGEEEAGEDAKPPSAETILELAYLRDPSLFDRDAQARRSKGRADLKAQTRLGDEQIEGWRIMLERNPRKDNILAKHEFRGNQHAVPVAEPGPSRGGHGGGGRGHPRGGRGSGRGRGRGGGGGGGAGAEGGDTRDRAMKDRHKASRANHNRKRGHDKKMARMGGPSS